MFDDKKSINIMHISDLHCGIEKSGNQALALDRMEVIEAFYKSLNKVGDDWMPDIITITGDIGWNGREEDYELFSIFLSKLLQELKLSVDDVICCPGNHDKYLPRGHKFSKEIRKAKDYYSVSSIYEYLGIFASDFAAYCNGLRKSEIKPLINQSDIEGTKFLYGYRIIKGLCFVVLNSAWLCDWRKKDINDMNLDRGNLIIDVNTICEIIGMGLPKLPIIVMYHHPKEWLKESEAWSSNNMPPSTMRRIEKVADIILNGHVHIARGQSNRDYLQYVSGTINSDGVPMSECVLLKIYIDQDNAKSVRVDEARYYSMWHNGKVNWYFEVVSGDHIGNGRGSVKDNEEIEQIIRNFFEAYQKDSNLLSNKQLEIIKEGTRKQLIDMLNEVLSRENIRQSWKSLFSDFMKVLLNHANDDAEEKEHEKTLIRTPIFPSSSDGGKDK